MFDHAEPTARFSLLSRPNILAAAHAIAAAGRPLSERMLSDCCEQARRRPGRTIRFWLLSMYLTGLLERVRRRGAWHYSPSGRLRDLLEAGGECRPPIQPHATPAADYWSPDDPTSLGL